MRFASAFFASLFLVACGGGAGSGDPDALPTGRGDVAASSSDVVEGDPEAPLATDVKAPLPEPSSSPSAPSAPATKPDVATVTIDGVAMTVDSVTLWAPNPVNAKETDLFVKFHGTGAASGTDVAISATSLGAGCTPGGNFVTYRPEGDTQYMPAQTPTCGFSVTDLPTAIGDRFTGTFEGTLTSINVTPSKTHKVKVTFDVARTK